MAHEVRGVVAQGQGCSRSRSRPSRSPIPARARRSSTVQACGVCHTDLHYREGGINDDFPFLLGHEAAGVGRGGRSRRHGVAPGDFVILNWRAVCGSAGRAGGASRGTASPPTTPRRR